MSTKHSLEQIINISKDVYKISSLNQAFIDLADSSRLVLNSQWSQIDFEKNERTKYQKNYIFDIASSISEKSVKDQPKLIHVTRPQPLRNEVWNVKSRNGLLTAIVTNWEENKEEKQSLEIWDSNSRVKNINLTKLKKHSKIYEKSMLSSFVWSSDSLKLAYIAEAKTNATNKCLITSKYEKNNNNADSAKKDDDLVDENNYLDKYANFHNDSWGEQLSNKIKSVIVVFDLVTDEFNVIDSFPEDFMPVNISWYKNEGFVFSAFRAKPYKLGYIYCPNRKSELFYYDLNEKKLTKLTSYESDNLRDPRFSSDFENLCWLQNPAFGPHFQCSKLMMMNWKTKAVSTLIDMVNDSKDDEFPGIFTPDLGENCWSADSRRILLSTNWRHSNTIICFNLDTKQITRLNKDIDTTYSTALLDFKSDWMSAILKGCNRKPSIIVAKLPESGSESNLKWTLCDKNEELVIKSIDVEIIKLKPEEPSSKYPSLTFESIFVHPKEKNGVLVVFPHGGPHSAFACELNPHVVVLNQLGYSVLMINYRGSIGYGKDSVDSLPGFIGFNDVKDCQQAAEHVMKKYSFSKATVYGGSHGGFLSTHLIGQYPEFYSAASVRNPVTHLETMLALSDIPDWIMNEAIGKYDYDYKEMATPEIYSRLHEQSPTKYIDQVKTPILFMVGKVDLRVPPSQSMVYYKALIARNIPTNLLIYKDDCHPLEIPQTTADCIVNTVLWYEKYLS